ncbi:MAG TPA: VCBS repeat-containing protein [Kofleriaceae bacterium]|nr:VCBS repeat-containing protein [Kofleriaceae bacterium]
MKAFLKHVLPAASLLTMSLGACAPADDPAAATDEAPTDQLAPALVTDPGGGGGGVTTADTSCSAVPGRIACVPQTYNAFDAFGLPSQWQTVTGDFNGDGLTDFARLGGTFSQIFYANGAGRFIESQQAYSRLDFGIPSLWIGVSGDFNGDGKDDYARVGATGVWIFQSTGNTTGSNLFTPRFVAYASGLTFDEPTTWETIVGDFDGDGRTDIGRLGDHQAWILHFDPATPAFFRQDHQLYNNPDVNFGQPTKWKTVVGDFNGDGKTDYGRLGDAESWFFYANPALTQKFAQDKQVYEAPIIGFGLPSSFQTVVGDFNGDGRDDYMRLDSAGEWTFESTSGTNLFRQGFVAYSTVANNFGNPSTWTPVVGDFNGDGKVDYARIGDTGAWLFYSVTNALGNLTSPINQEFDGYVGLSFGQPTPWTTIAGKFSTSGHAGYARLGSTAQFTFFHL